MQKKYFDYFQKFAELPTPEKGAKFGTTELKKFVSFLAEFIPQIGTIAEDKKITFWESVGLAPALIQGSRLLLNLRQVGEELRDLDQKEKDELIAYLKEQPIFNSQTSADVIEILDTAAEMVINFYETFKLGVKLAKLLKQ